MMLKAITSSKGMSSAVSIKLCPSCLLGPHRRISLLRICLHLPRCCLCSIKLDLVPDRGGGGIQHARRQFKHCRRLPKKTRNTKRAHVLFHRNHLPLAIENRNIDRGQHSPSVNALRRDDQQSVAGQQAAFAQQTHDALQSGIRHSNALAHLCSARHVDCAQRLLMPKLAHHAASRPLREVIRWRRATKMMTTITNRTPATARTSSGVIVVPPKSSSLLDQV